MTIDKTTKPLSCLPPLDCDVGQRIERYLRQLAPHQAEREGPKLLLDARAEIAVLRKLLQQVLSDAQA